MNNNITYIIATLFSTMQSLGYQSFPTYITNGNINRWGSFQFGSITIDVGCLNCLGNYTYIINAYPWYGKMPEGFYEDTFHVCNGISSGELFEDEVEEYCKNLVRVLLSNKMVLESGLDTEKMKVFSKHPTFYVRNKNGRAIFFDGETKAPFWETTKVIKTRKEGNGYWVLQTKNTKYQFCFA